MAKLFWEIYAAVGTLGILAWPEHVLHQSTALLQEEARLISVVFSEKRGGWGRGEGEQYSRLLRLAKLP